MDPSLRSLIQSCKTIANLSTTGSVGHDEFRLTVTLEDKLLQDRSSRNVPTGIVCNDRKVVN